MRVKVYNASGDMCFKLIADSDADAAALGIFVDQNKDRKIVMSDTYDADSRCVIEINFYQEGK